MFIQVFKKKKNSHGYLLWRYASQVCPNLLRAIYTGSTPFRHLGNSLEDINTLGNETQSNDFGDVRWLTEMPLHLT